MAYQSEAHTFQLRDLQRYVEDLDNCRRRHNLHVCGLPESVDRDQLLPNVVGIFSNLLDRTPTTPIDLERIHRSLRPKRRESDPPKVIVCCLVDFQLKEEILRKARNRI